MVRVQHLRKAYDGLVAVDGIGFEVAAGETFGLLGPNGAGKTTTLLMLVGLIGPDAGEIDVGGLGSPRQSATRRAIGFAPQELSLYKDMTAEENLALFGRLYGLHRPQARQRLAVLLDRAGLTERGGDLVRTYSGGMQRRLHLACALIHDPPVLLLDEPTIGVDPQARHHILEDIERLKSQGRTIILTTHYMEEAQRLCDRVAIMDRGRILAMDTVPQLIRAHGGHSVIEATLDAPLAADDPLGRHFDGEVFIEATDQPFETIRQLAARNVGVQTLSVRQPSLETVFLNLTGRRLRD